MAASREEYNEVVMPSGRIVRFNYESDKGIIEIYNHPEDKEPAKKLVLDYVDKSCFGYGLHVLAENIVVYFAKQSRYKNWGGPNSPPWVSDNDDYIIHHLEKNITRNLTVPRGAQHLFAPMLHNKTLIYACNQFSLFDEEQMTLGPNIKLDLDIDEELHCFKMVSSIKRGSIALTEEHQEPRFISDSCIASDKMDNGTIALTFQPSPDAHDEDKVIYYLDSCLNVRQKDVVKEVMDDILKMPEPLAKMIASYRGPCFFSVDSAKPSSDIQPLDSKKCHP